MMGIFSENLHEPSPPRVCRRDHPTGMQNRTVAAGRMRQRRDLIVSSGQQQPDRAASFLPVADTGQQRPRQRTTVGRTDPITPNTRRVSATFATQRRRI
ncbi:unnamed protein product [Heligmosomoides polygyrus]|uniref:Uncharacterized protein n=1 Tax=Heligmosomoides polygyrus TaxID=6339 RepID=A0A183FEK7_HELPZ|nr:unnamed protein product [Heligmosomoides polygyrus]